MKTKLLAFIVIGTLLSSVFSLDVALASDLHSLRALPVGTIFIDGDWYELRFLEGRPHGAWDQILLYDPSGKAVGTLAFKVRPAAENTTVIENPLPIVSGKTSMSEGILFSALYTGLFSYLVQMRPETLEQGLRIEFTDVPEGTVHPAITLPLKQFGFEAIGGRTITIEVPQERPLLPQGKGIRIPQFRSIQYELSNRYRLTNPQQFISQLSNIISGTGS